MPETPVIAWPVSSFEALTQEDFDALIAIAPEVVYTCSAAARACVSASAADRQALQQRIGVETMDFGARMPYLQHSHVGRPPGGGCAADRGVSSVSPAYRRPWHGRRGKRSGEVSGAPVR